MDVCCDLLVEGAAGPSFAELRPQPPPAHILALLPEPLRVGLNGYALDVSALDALESEVNGAPGGSSAVEELLRGTLPSDRRWAFVFDLHCDQVDEVFRVSDVEELIRRLRANLHWDGKRIGFIACHLPASELD